MHLKFSSFSNRRIFSRSIAYSSLQPKLSPRRIIQPNPEELFAPLEKKTKNFKPYYQQHPEVANLSPATVAAWRKEHEITYIGDSCPNPILDFKQLPFPERVIQYLTDNYPAPTSIQSQSWPIIMSGRDMVGSAKTGSGKTLAFILPALEHIRCLQPPRGQFPTALVLAPTRELVQQIQTEAHKFRDFYNINSTACFGGQGNRSNQVRSLSYKPQLVVAAPGRLLDFINNEILDLSSVNYLVLDEADRMLDMGFEPQIREIVRATGSRQTLMFSATWPKAVQSLCTDYLDNPIRINIGSLDLSANPDIEQKFVYCDEKQKLNHFLNFLKKNPQTKTLVFAQTKIGVDVLAREIVEAGIHEKLPFATLHGDKMQSYRNNIYQDFQSDKLMMVIATDVASRGLDVKDIDLVINYDMTQNIGDYIHRIGRTARAGKKGTSLTFLTPNDSHIVKDLQGVITKAGQSVPQELNQLEQDRFEDTREKYAHYRTHNTIPTFKTRPITQYGDPQNNTFNKAKDYLENIKRNKF